MIKIQLFLLVFSTVFIVKGFSQFGAEKVIFSCEDCAITGLHFQDLNGDNRVDILAYSSKSSIVEWHQNLGEGLFSPPKVIGNGSRISLFIDIDNDDDLDIILNGNTILEAKTSLVVNDGIGEFSEEQMIIDGDGEPLVLGHYNSVGDLDGDGDMDLITGFLYDIRWYENLGQNMFSGRKEITGIEIFDLSGISTLDIDNDGDIDILTTHYYGETICWKNEGGKFSAEANNVLRPPSDFNPIFSMPIDVDSDNDLDIIIIGDSSDEIVLFENGGAGNFDNDNKKIIDNLESIKSVFSSDLDDDGDNDIVYTSTGGGSTIYWNENDGIGNFSPKKIVAENLNNPKCIAAYDIDDDGKKEIIFSSESFYKISILDTDFSNTTSTNDLIDLKDVILFPNPFQAILNIEQESIQSSNLSTISIFDVTGRLALSTNLKAPTQQISTAHLANGLYFYQVINGDNQIITNGKVIKH